MKNIGVWLDKEKAHIVILGKQEEFITINSNLEHFHPSGGMGTKFKGGPQDVVQDSKYLEREKHQLREYFKELSTHLDQADSIVIFGPAETYLKLKKELETNYKDINSKIKASKKADSMTDNQVKSWVRDFFSH